MNINEYNWTPFNPLPIAWEDVAKAHAAKKLPPVMMLSGLSGIGKRAFANYVAALSVCRFGNACGECADCVAVLNLNHPEVAIFDDPEKMNIAQAEELQNHIETLPQADGKIARFRVVILVNAERLTLAAANRLLKTMEEPHEKARIILTTTETSNLPKTVLSRCIQLRVSPPTMATASEIIRRFCDMPITDSELEERLTSAQMAPWFLIESQKSEQSTQALADTFKSYLSSGRHSFAEVVSFCEQELKSKKPKQVVQAFEIALNYEYKRELKAGRSSQPEHYKRRELVRTFRQLAEKRQIQLNAQLTSEALLLAGFERGN